MKISLVKCLSILVASGNGSKCNDVCAELRSNMISRDQETGLSKVELFKSKSGSEASARIRKEVARIVLPKLNGINDHYWGPDKSIDTSNSN